MSTLSFGVLLNIMIKGVAMVCFILSGQRRGIMGQLAWLVIFGHL